MIQVGLQNVQAGIGVDEAAKEAGTSDDYWRLIAIDPDSGIMVTLAFNEETAQHFREQLEGRQPAPKIETAPAQALNDLDNARLSRKQRRQLARR